MRSKTLKFASVALAAGLVLAACGSDDDDEDTTATTAAGSSETTAGNTETTEGGSEGGTDIDFESLSGELTASGASFPDAYYQEVIVAFADVAPDVTVTYNSTGSGTGKEEFGQGLTDFAGTDSLVKPDDGPAEGSFSYVPTVAAPITISYNLSGVDELHLSASTLADIFQATITNWNDPAIAEDNPDAELPDETITVVHRSDGSGTTSNFTKYLDAAADNWTLGAGDTVAWPASTQGGERNTGVAQLISSTDGAIGYVDLSDADATGLVYASIENAAGEFVAPTLEGATAALEGAVVEDDLSYNPLNAEGAEAYPITSPTFILVRTDYDPAVAELVKGFLTFLLTDGQDLAEEVGYAALPDGLRQQALDKVSAL